jgi:hypothetical protein
VNRDRGGIPIQWDRLCGTFEDEHERRRQVSEVADRPLAAG